MCMKKTTSSIGVHFFSSFFYYYLLAPSRQKTAITSYRVSIYPRIWFCTLDGEIANKKKVHKKQDLLNVASNFCLPRAAVTSSRAVERSARLSSQMTQQSASGRGVNWLWLMGCTAHPSTSPDSGGERKIKRIVNHFVIFNNWRWFACIAQ